MPGSRILARSSRQTDSTVAMSEEKPETSPGQLSTITKLNKSNFKSWAEDIEIELKLRSIGKVITDNEMMNTQMVDSSSADEIVHPTLVLSERTTPRDQGLREALRSTTHVIQ